MTYLMRDIIRLRTAAQRCREMACTGRTDAAVYLKLTLEIEAKIAARETALRAAPLPGRAAPAPQRLAA